MLTQELMLAGNKSNITSSPSLVTSMVDVGEPCEEPGMNGHYKLR